MRFHTRGVPAAILTLALCACTHAGDAGSSSMSQSLSPSRYSPGSPMILGYELRDHGQSRNLYDAVRAIRPSFVYYLGTRPTVIVDGIGRGTIETLNDISVDAVEAVRLLSAPEATMRFGPTHNGAVLLVITRRP
jgi:hypothetical protein